MELDSHLTLQDKVRLWLGERGTRYVPLTTDALGADLKVTSYTAYQTLFRLQQRNEIVIETSDDKRVTGVTINKLEQSGRTYQRAANKAKESNIAPTNSAIEQMTQLRSYLDKKLAVSQMRQRAIEAGLNPDDTVVFEENAIAEEGLMLLNLVQEAFDELKKTKTELKEIGYDLEAAKRDNEYLKGKIKEDTRGGLLAIAAG